jgi:hypothetical protein
MRVAEVGAAEENIAGRKRFQCRLLGHCNTLTL